MKRNFDEWLNNLKPSINNYNYFIDFEKIINKVNKIKKEILLFEKILKEKNISEKFQLIVSKHPEILKVVQTLFALRKNEVYCYEKGKNITYNFKDSNKIFELMIKTGLLEFLQTQVKDNLYNLILGIEIGLDTNARKNRGGHQMEDLVEEKIKETKVEYYKEMYLEDIEKKWGIDLSKISANGVSTKRWDYVVKKENQIYVIETNFYNASGSKLNEVARSYKKISEQAKKINNFTFLWITDGYGWKHTKRNLKETFEICENLYNINDLENKILFETFK